MRGGFVRKSLSTFALCILVIAAVGCESLLEPQAVVTGGMGGPSMGQAMAVPYNGPKARIAVAAFENSTGKGHRIGDGMADMLATELFNSNRFIVLEREELGAVLAEQDLAKAGRVAPGTAAPTGQIEGAELLIKGAITEFEPRYQGGAGGILAPNLPGVLGARFNQAHIAIDMRVIDARTSRLVAATSVTGRASDFGGLVGTAIGGGSTRMGIGLSGYRNTPMEKAVRVCIAKAVQFIASRTPPQFYHYNAMNQPMQPMQPAAPGPGGAYAPPGAWPTTPAPAGTWPTTPTPRATPSVYTPSQPTTPAAPVPPTVPTAPGPGQAAPTELPKQVYVSLASVRLFERPDASSTALTTAVRGTPLGVQGADGNWYAVALPDGRVGWILKSFTTTVAP